MSVGSELDVDMQDLVNVLSRIEDVADLQHMDPSSERWADSSGELLAQLLRMGWLPPTYTAHVAAKVKQAWEAEEDNEAFEALNSAANALNVELVDPHADTLNSLTLGMVA